MFLYEIDELFLGLYVPFDLYALFSADGAEFIWGKVFDLSFSDLVNMYLFHSSSLSRVSAMVHLPLVGPVTEMP